MASKIKPADAICLYFLSQRQGVKMIAYLSSKSVEEVNRYIREGERLLAERKDTPDKQARDSV